MIAKGFLQEVDADMRKGEPVWRETGDGHGVTLIATDAGLAAVGIETEDADTAPVGATDAPTDEAASDTPAGHDAAPKARTPREGTKQATLIAMLRTPDGATIEDISAATGWQSHTVRGAMAGALKKKLGLEVTSRRSRGAAGSTGFPSCDRLTSEDRIVAASIRRRRSSTALPLIYSVEVARGLVRAPFNVHLRQSDWRDLCTLKLCRMLFN